jgi:hypothetical protein
MVPASTSWPAPAPVPAAGRSDAKQLQQCRLDLGKDGGIEGVKDLLPLPFGAHQIGALEDVEVVRQRAPRDVDMLRQVARRAWPAPEQLEDLASLRVGEGAKDRFSHFDVLMFIKITLCAQARAMTP